MEVCIKVGINMYICRAVTRGAAGAARAAPLFRPFFFFFDFIEITENNY